MVPILNQMNSRHTLPPYFSKIHYNIVFPNYAYIFQVVSSVQLFRPNFCVEFRGPVVVVVVITITITITIIIIIIIIYSRIK
jgi:hypothetical protein